jgi:(+)-trans-carveol dehydrogenase
VTVGRVGGRVALVTGAARGIGRACAVRLAEEGADVALLDIARGVQSVVYQASGSTQLEETGALVQNAGARALPLMVDVRDSAALDVAVEATLDAFGRIDILVAAAGIDSWGRIWELTDDQWGPMLDVNLTGVWRTAKAVTPHMIKRGEGAMVFIASVGSHKALPNFGHYVAAKHGVLGLVREFAVELAPFGIRVNSVDPTVVETDMVMSQPYRDFVVGHPDATKDELAAYYLERNLGITPWIQPIDVANAVLFLSSDEARAITGVGLPVDAGAMLR